MEYFDVVINVGPKDEPVIRDQIKYTLENIVGRHRVYLISYDPTLTVEGAITVPETAFPFTIADVEAKFGKACERNGWYLQQLFKLYAHVAIPALTRRYLCLDADTYFLKPTKFIDDDDGRALLTTSEEFTIAYMDHMRRLHPSLERVGPYSGITHHMMFETACVQDLFRLVEGYHKKPFWRAFLDCVDQVRGSGASEYDIYFNFVILYHSDKIRRRELRWQNTDRLEPEKGFDYVSMHWYFRKT